MTVAQSLVGAMGCASWRVRSQLREYAAVAPAGGVITGGATNLPAISSVAPWGLNEVGVTDAAMATLWRFGPGGAAYAVTSGAEAHHLGADVAIIHHSTKRLLLYQAKLARLDGASLRLKSPAPAAQIRRLRRRHVDLAGVTFDVTARLALYQIDHAPFLDACSNAPFNWWRPWWWDSTFEPRPHVGRDYYKGPLLHGSCSPSGILAAPVPASGPVTSVPVASTWPWEFDAYDWLHTTSRLDDPDWPPGKPTSNSRQDTPERDDTPDFDQYSPQGGRADDGAEAIATSLAEQLRLPKRWMLFVISI